MNPHDLRRRVTAPSRPGSPADWARARRAARSVALGVAVLLTLVAGRSTLAGVGSDPPLPVAAMPIPEPDALWAGAAGAEAPGPPPISPHLEPLGVAPMDEGDEGAGGRVLVLARLIFPAGARLDLDGGSGTILLALESGGLAVALAEGEARVGRGTGGPSQQIGAGGAAVVGAGDWLAVEPGTTLVVRNAGEGPAVAVVSIVGRLPVRFHP